MRGLVIDAGTRDVAALEKIGFPRLVSSHIAKGTVQSTLGCVNIPLVRGGVAVRPGDIIVADDDGVVVVPAAADTLAAAGKRQASEEGETGKLASGVLGLDLYEMRPALEKAGLRYVKKLEDL